MLSEELKGLGYLQNNEVDVYVPRAYTGSVMCPDEHELLSEQELSYERDDDFIATHITIDRICHECHEKIIIRIEY